MKTVVRGFHNMIIEESGFNGSCGWVISSRRVKEITTFTLRVNGQFTDLWLWKWMRYFSSKYLELPNYTA